MIDSIVPVECMEEVILVNVNDQKIGQMEKLQAHREGLLHRAVSVCIFDHRGRWCHWTATPAATGNPR